MRVTPLGKPRERERLYEKQRKVERELERQITDIDWEVKS
jgi:hypothetical protein